MHSHHTILTDPPLDSVTAVFRRGTVYGLFMRPRCGSGHQIASDRRLFPLLIRGNSGETDWCRTHQLDAAFQGSPPYRAFPLFRVAYLKLINIVLFFLSCAPEWDRTGLANEDDPR